MRPASALLLNRTTTRARIARAMIAALSFAFTIALCVLTTPSVQAQTFHLLYTFTGGADGAGPQPGLTIGGPANFYGATGSVGLSPGNCDGDCGTIFRFSNAGSGWTLTPLYHFQGPPDDGLFASGRVLLAPDGSLFGITNQGGNGPCQFGCGTVFHVTATGSALALWNESVLYNFVISQGWYPQGDLAIDAAGNLYGTAATGGPSGNGVTYQLARSGDHWNYNILYSFQDSFDGAGPAGGVVFDASGNIYGVTVGGGNPAGAQSTKYRNLVRPGLSKRSTASPTPVDALLWEV